MTMTSNEETRIRLVKFSGGAGSWMAAKRVAERYGTQGLVLLTADTGSEGDDWHEFVHAAAEDVGGELVMVSGRYSDLWQGAMKRKMMPSVWHGWCTIEQKIKPMEEWREANCVPENTTIYFGYDWTEEHRLKRSRERLDADGWPYVDAPLMWQPIVSKAEVLDALKASSLPYPKAYELGIAHNNCLATGCFKQGEAAWRQLLRLMPDVYANSEAREQEFIAHLQAEGREHRKVGMIYRRAQRGSAVGGELLTLREFRLRVEQQGDLFAASDSDDDDWGSCGCFETEADDGDGDGDSDD